MIFYRFNWIQGHGFFRAAIPIMPLTLAILCCIMNFIVPGSGKILKSTIILRKNILRNNVSRNFGALLFRRSWYFAFEMLLYQLVCRDATGVNERRRRSKWAISVYIVPVAGRDCVVLGVGSDVHSNSSKLVHFWFRSQGRLPDVLPLQHMVIYETCENFVKITKINSIYCVSCQIISVHIMKR